MSKRVAEAENDCSGTQSKHFRREIVAAGTPPRLDAAFYQQTCETLAKQLLGKILCRQVAGGRVLRGRIVETESYLGVADGASHSYGGRRTARNAAMFMAPGTIYVYPIYGMYECVNLSSLEEGSAVLIRAIGKKDKTAR
jgi:DNA-3-methyladenine glycosylase